MKPKKQQPASERKPTGAGSSSTAQTGSAGSGSGGGKVEGPGATASNANANSSSSTAAAVPTTKKPVKRLQSKAKENATTAASGGSGAGASTSSAVGEGVKSAEKQPPTPSPPGVAACTSTQSNKAKSTPASAGKGNPSAGASKVAGSVEPAKDSQDGTVTTEEGCLSTTTTAGSALPGIPETIALPPCKGSKGDGKKIKSDSNAGSGTPSKKSAKATVAGSASKKATASQADRADGGVGKKKQSTNAQSAGSVGSAEGRTVAASSQVLSSDPKLREKEKKIQKELKNLGVPDKAINQSIVDAAYLLDSDESVVNPSISEMVKTKSRTTVAQGKYGAGEPVGPVGRKASVTSEEATSPPEVEEKSPKESGVTGKAKKSVTLKLDLPDEAKSVPQAKQPAGKAGKELVEKVPPTKGGRKDDKGTPVAKSSTTKASGNQAGKGSKKAPGSASGTSESKQKKTGSGVATVAPVVTPKSIIDQKDLLDARKPPSELGSKTTTAQDVPTEIGGRSSSVEQDEEKNEEVHIRIDSIVKALEQEDIEAPAVAPKQDFDGDSKRDGSAVIASTVPPLTILDSKAPGKTEANSAPTEGKMKKPPTARKPALKKDTASAKAKAKEAADKKKPAGSVAEATVTDKKEVKFKEQTPASSAKRKYVKKTKSAQSEETAGGEKPTKMAKKPSAAKKAAAGGSKTKPMEANPGAFAETMPERGTSGTFEPPPQCAKGDQGMENASVTASDATGTHKNPLESHTSGEPSVNCGATDGAIRSSTENDDDVPLRQLQQKQERLQPVAKELEKQTGDVKSSEAQPMPRSGDTQPIAAQESGASVQGEAQCNEPETNASPSATGPILAGLLKGAAKPAKRPYVRKNASGGGGKSSKVTAFPGGSSAHPCEDFHASTKERKLEKKDVYDFDDSESEIETPVKPGKPSFKRKSSVDASQSREDISREGEEPEPVQQRAAEGKKVQPDSDGGASAVVSSADERRKDATAAPKRIALGKKQKKRAEPSPVVEAEKAAATAALPSSSALKKEAKNGSSSDSELDEGAETPGAKVKKKASVARKLKQEAKDSSHSSDEEDDRRSEAGKESNGEDDGGDEEEEEDEEEGNSDADSDGCSSTDTVRTRIAKKRQSAKKRNVKLYGFWSGPKRHRVASLNALAKVHCLYENEMRGALEASLMSQSSGSRVIRTITKDGERIKKERICNDDDSAGEESRSGEPPGGGTVGTGEGSEGHKDPPVRKEEKKPEDKRREEKKEGAKQEKKEPAQPPSGGPKEPEPKAKVKEEAPKKERSDQDSADSSEEEPVVMRSLRCVPGLRGAGKHWDPDASSLESEIEQLPDSDETYAQGKDTDPNRKRKVKKKVARKSKAKITAAAQAKLDKAEKDRIEKAEQRAAERLEKSEKPPKPPVKKIKKELKALMMDNEKLDDGTASSSSSGSEKAGPGATTGGAKSKAEEGGPKKRKREPKSEKAEIGGDFKEYIGKKRMASLNATAMLAATYEVQRVLYRNTDSSDSECSAEKAPKSKKVAKETKDQKDTSKGDAKDKKEACASEKERTVDATATVTTSVTQPPLATPPDSKQLLDPVVSASSSLPSTSGTAGCISVAQQEVLTKKKKVVIKTEPMRDRKDDPMEVKREIEEPRPVSSNLVIAQDTEVTITGVYVNSSLGTNQEAYCKMQYRVQQSVTEERLVRPGEAPPKSYTPLSALSSMRPPNDQSLSTPPLFVPPAQCDSPLGPPRSFYPPPTSSSGSSSAFCAPLPHDSPGYYQPVGPLISPLHLAQPPTSQHGSGLSGLLGKSGPDGGSPLPGPPQPPPSSTADSTDSDVLLTGGDLLPRSSQHQQQQQAAYGAARYGPAPGGPPANLYGRPMQMHCPPAYLPQSYYAPSPYGQPPPPHPPPPPPEMYYTHAYPAAHYYPKFAPPQYYPTASRRYYPGPAPGPEHLYEQAPPGGAPVPQPPPPPAGAQLVPAGPPQGPQHLDHYPYPAYPGYGSPGPGSGGQCYPRNLPHPPPFMDTHYSANCPCPMQCPKNVNAGSLIGIKASKGPVANKNNNTHIVQSQTSMSTEPITISSSSSSASSSVSPAPAPLDIHTPITMASESASSDPSSQTGIHGHGYHHHGGHHGVPHHLHPSHQYHQHHQHQYPRQPALSEPASTAGLASSTVAPSVVTVTTTHPATPPRVVTTATSADHHYHHHHLHQPSQPHHPAKMCYKTEQLIKPESSAELLSTPMHYGNPYHHHYHHAAMGYYHHPKLAELKEEPPSHGGDLGGKLGGAPLPTYSIASKMALLETPELPASPARGSTGLSVPPMLGEAMQPPLIPRDGEKKGLIEEKVGDEEKLSHQDKKTISPNAVVKQEIEEFKLDLGLVSGGAMCKKEDFEETGPAMTPDLLDESIVIKKDRDEEKPPTSRAVDATYHQQQQLHDLHHQHHLQLGPPPSEPSTHHLHHLQQVAAHHPHLHHHSASTNLLHGPPPLHHHHLHPHYTLHISQPQQQQQPQPRMATGLSMETDDKEANNLLPPDSKSLLTELVLTTEASMESRNSPALPDASTRVASSKTISSFTTTTTIGSSGTVQHQPRDSSSSDNSLSLSDSLAIPSADADTDAIASRSISIDGAKVQSRDGDDTTQHRDTVDPPSPVPIPASTVKRRPLLVACKKATPKQSPPNSYKNLIKRTNGTDEGEDLRAAVECLEAVELSDEEEEGEEEEEVDEEVEEEEEEEEEEEDEEDEENEEAEEEEDDDEEEDDEEGVGVEDVEDVELEEQRKVLAEQQRQRGATKGASRNGGGSKVVSKKRTGTKMLTDGGRRKGLVCARKLLTTTTTTTTTTAFVAPRDRHRRQALNSVQKKLLSPPTAAPRRPRKFSVKHVRRVFRTSIESLKRLPPALQGRLLGRSNVTLVRRTIRKRTLQSPEKTSPRPSPTITSCDVPQQNSNIAEEFEAPKSPSVGSGKDRVASATIDENESKQTETEGCPIVLLDQQQAPAEPHTGLDAICEGTASEAPPVSQPIPMTIPLSNVDRTIDLVARGYFSEPEILTRSTELKLHSRAWLKRLKQQQQQEGRSHSEQSRGAAGSKSGCPAAKKGKKKTSPLADVVASALEDRPAVVAEKKTKCRTKSSKNVPAPEGESVPCSIENSEPKGKKKSSSKEHKKESSKKKKQKVANDGGQDSEGRGRKRANVKKPNASRPATVAPIEETEAMYQRATSTPIPHSNGLVTGDDSIVVRQAEEEHLKGGSILDESGVTPMDQSSVIDDRETDFDDAATMLVEDDVASVDTSVLVNRHNNNNNSAVTDKNNPSDEQCTIGEQVTLDAPLQAVIAEGKEGSELEPPEGMEPFMDEEQEEQLQQDQLKQQEQAMQPHDVQLLPPPVSVQEYAPRVMAPAAKQPLPTYDDEELEDQKPGSSRSVKRRRSRSKSKSKKFSKRKRHRPSHRGATAEPEELIVPRKRASSPRWSNGWTWEGQPFQGKVFLNSDDPPILRTCYPAMRHVQGDIVRPRDCVLLKAGSKRAELPYVAKVAHLWENLEDGEMMMSLLWYYRPEHTEQGRQQTDGPDEVFASRHKDHNSVACIEDKCYVLTFSEYCRFRRQLKGLEENIEEQPSIVPPLRRENPRLPPAIVSPELVMYCQRVYEFRQKRLLKSTS